MGFTVGVAGVSGYTGGEVVRLVSLHPDFDLGWVGGHGSAGRELRRVHPWLEVMPGGSTVAKMAINPLDDGVDLSGLDLLFVSLPAGESSAFLAALGGSRPARVVDIGPDFRLSAESFEEWYGKEHPLASELDEWIYGFTEAFRSRVAGARYVANPGCYATAALTALYPLAKERMLSGCVYIDGKSGLSGAGRGTADYLLLSEATEDASPYAVGGHRHHPEIEGTLRGIHPETSVVFVPHLVPMARGLLVTAYAPLRSRATAETVAELYLEVYASEPFVAVSEDPPHTKSVRGANSAVVHTAVQASGSEGNTVAIVTAAIDNLGKGAAGSAVQNANVMVGVDETAGLCFPGIWP